MKYRNGNYWQFDAPDLAIWAIETLTNSDILDKDSEAYALWRDGGHVDELVKLLKKYPPASFYCQEDANNAADYFTAYRHEPNYHESEDEHPRQNLSCFV